MIIEETREGKRFRLEYKDNEWCVSVRTYENNYEWSRFYKNSLNAYDAYLFEIELHDYYTQNSLL